MTVYRIKLFTDIENHAGDKEYCLQNNLIAIGWGFESERITDVALYKEKAQKEIKNKGFKASYNNIISMNKGDIVWTKVDGMTYRQGIIDSDCFIVDNDEKCRMGLARKCIWNKTPINFNDVPGQVMSSFVGGGYVLTNIHVNSELEEYCNYLYNQQNNKFLAKLSYKNLLHADDLEDLLGLYLQDPNLSKDSENKYNLGSEYYIIPSTNKTSTKYIEYELRTKNGDKACVQCKIGGAKVSDEIFELEQFKDYRIFISTMNDNSYNKKGNNVTTIYTYDLWDWAKNNKEILPERMKKYIEICE